MRCVMTRKLNALLALTITLSLIWAAAAVPVYAADRHARDLVILTTWFEGQFDNDEQLWFEQDYRWQGNESDKHRRNHATHIRLDMPKIGEHVFFVEEYLDNDPENVWRRRLVSFDSHAERGLRLKLYFIKDNSIFESANPLDTIKNYDLDDVSDLPGCDIWFVREGEQYKGMMEPQACAFGEGEERRYSEHTMIISQNQYWRFDRTWLFSNGEQHSGETASEPSRMRRAHNYSCDVSLPYESYAKPNEKDVKLKGLIVHDQGGTTSFEDPRTGKIYDLQLREKEYPYYTEGSEFFLLRIKEQGAKSSAALVTTAPRPEKVSVNLGKISAFCQRQ